MHTHKQRKQSITIWHNGNNFLRAMKANNAAVCVKWLKLVLGAFVKLPVCGRDRVHYKSAPQSLNISTWKQQMCNKSMWHRLTIQLTPFSFIKRDAITQKSDEAQLLPPDPCWPKKSCLVNFGLATFSLSVMCKLSLLLCGHQGNEWKQDSMATHQHCLILLSVTSP